MNDDITVEIVGDLQPDNKRPKSNVVRQQNMVVGTGGGKSLHTINAHTTRI